MDLIQMKTVAVVLACAAWMLAVAMSAEVPLNAAAKDSHHLDIVGPWGEQPAYTVQSGYEGYLVPVESLSIKDVFKNAGIIGVFPIVAKFAGRMALKGVVVVAGLAIIGILALLITSGICKYTPFCYFSLAHHWDREAVRSLVSQDRIESAARFLASAVNKFSQLEDKSDGPVPFQ